ncbi:MAG: phosphate ABC transporter substrate-binding protein [Gemmatimonadales bacterium]
MLRNIRIALGTAVLIVLGAHSAAAQEYKVIVNSANATSEISSDALGKIFLKQVSKFPDGATATPVEPAKASPARAAFAKAVLGRSVQNLESFWQQQIFSGKDVPPANKASDDDVVAFVKSTPGAIGYVSGTAAVAGVKVVAVK